MGKFDYEAGGDLSNGDTWLAEPGTYHLMIVEMQEEPTSKDGNLIPNAAFRVACVVGDGTVAGQKDKTTDITFFQPKSSDKNEGAFARKKIDRFFVAVGLATEQQIKDKAKLSIDLQDAVGSQFSQRRQRLDDALRQPANRLPCFVIRQRLHRRAMEARLGHRRWRERTSCAPIRR